MARGSTGVTGGEHGPSTNSREVAATSQRANGKYKRLSVDHDHKTGIIRGLLCTMCNKYTLGWARDCIEFFKRAIAYLTNPPAVQVIGERIAPIEAERLSSDLTPKKENATGIDARVSEQSETDTPSDHDRRSSCARVVTWTTTVDVTG